MSTAFKYEFQPAVFATVVFILLLLPLLLLLMSKWKYEWHNMSITYISSSPYQPIACSARKYNTLLCKIDSLYTCIGKCGVRLHIQYLTFIDVLLLSQKRQGSPITFACLLAGLFVNNITLKLSDSNAILQGVRGWP